MRKIARRGWLTLVLVLAIGACFPQASQETGALTVSGHPGEVPVTQIGGRPYVAVDALAQLMNGSLGYRGRQITLTLPGNGHYACSSSRWPICEFGIFQRFSESNHRNLKRHQGMAKRLLTAVEYGYKMTDTLLNDYEAPAAKNLRWHP